MKREMRIGVMLCVVKSKFNCKCQIERDNILDIIELHTNENAERTLSRNLLRNRIPRTRRVLMTPTNNLNELVILCTGAT